VKISDQGIQLLIEREDLRTKAYLDTVGVPTIGVGHTGPEVYIGLEWTREKCVEVFHADLAKFEDAVNTGVKVDLLQHQFDALVSFSFNVGIGGFLSSTLLKKINLNDFEGAAAQFDRWHIPEEIISRRNGEREQFRGTQFAARI
jgi:lysozyme